MALRTPPSWLQNGSHPAENDRLTVQAQYATTGIIGSGSYAVSAQASPNMTVNVAAGWCAILGSTSSSGVYVAYNDAISVQTITAADASLPRIDRIVVTVSDAAYSGSTNTVAFQVLAGTPNASPSAPATPSNSISLATIAVAAGATSISAGNITDTRVAVTSNVFLPLQGGTVTGATTFSGATTVSGALAVSGVTTVTNTISSNTTITAASFTPSAGTVTVAPLKLTSGTNLTTPQAGAFEFDGSMAYFTPDTSGKRGLIPTEYVYSPSIGVVLASSTSAQSIFGVGITLPIGRYTYDLFVNISNGTTAHNTAFNFGGTANITSSVFSTGYSIAQQGSGAPEYKSLQGNTAINLFAATSTASTTNFQISGTFAVSLAGTVIPQVTFSVAPTGTNQVTPASFIRLRRVGGTASAAVSVGAWA